MKNLLTRDEFTKLFLDSGCFGSEEAITDLYQAVLEALSDNSKAEPTNQFIASYVDECRALHGFTPNVRGKMAGVAKRLVKEQGLARITDLMKTYLRMKDSRFSSASYDLICFERFLQVVIKYHETGSHTGRIQANQAEAQDANKQALLEYRARKGRI